MLTCVGVDLFGEQLLDALIESHLCCSVVVFDDRFRQVVLRFAYRILEHFTKVGLQFEIFERLDFANLALALDRRTKRRCQTGFVLTFVQ
jgi:hypothetical protein